MKINPTQLKLLRIQRGLSQKQLHETARVSERQISRIEGSDTDCEVREHTAQRLARVLGVEVATLAENATVDPDQLDVAGENEQSIHPQRLKSLRKQRKFSRRKLAERSGISERQIGRIETSDTDVLVRLSTLVKLAEALRVDTGKLVGGATDIDPLPVPPSQDVQLGIKLSPQVRLAYDLVQNRYGPSQQEIIQLAPLLFLLLAEGSLDWRRQWLGEAKETMKRMEQLAGERHQFGENTYNLTEEWDETFEDEYEAIQKNDLTGSLLNRGHWFYLGDISSPFLDYVEKLLKELNLSGQVNDWNLDDLENTINRNFGPGINLEERSNHRIENANEELKAEYLREKSKPGLLYSGRLIPSELTLQSGRYLHGIFFEDQYIDLGIYNHLICWDDLVEISGNSLGALFALMRGEVRLPQIPAELMTEQAKDQRVEWLESRMSEETQSMLAHYKTLFAEDYGHDFDRAT